MRNMKLILSFFLTLLVNNVCISAERKESYQLIGEYTVKDLGSGLPFLDISMSLSGKRLIVNYQGKDYFDIVDVNKGENNIVLTPFPYKRGDWHKTGYPIGMIKENDTNYKFLPPMKEDMEMASQSISDDVYFEDSNGNRLKTDKYLFPTVSGSVKGLNAVTGNKRIEISEKRYQHIQRIYYDPAKKRILALIQDDYVVYELKNGQKNKLAPFERNNREIMYYPVKGEDYLIKRTAQLNAKADNYIDMWLQVCDLKGNVVSNLTIFDKGADPESKDLLFLEATKEYLAVVYRDSTCMPDFRVKIFKRKIEQK